MTRQTVILHERLGQWARQLRPRLAGRPIRWVESRSTGDLLAALRGPSCPVVVIDPGARVVRGLEDLGRAANASPDALILLIDPGVEPGLAPLARQCGATLVLRMPVPPPRVAGLLERWLPAARRRAEAAGPAAEVPEAADRDPIDALIDWPQPNRTGPPRPDR